LTVSNRNLDFFAWGGGLEDPGGLPFGQQTYGLLCDPESGHVSGKLATVPGDTAIKCMYFTHVNILYDVIGSNH